MRVFPATTKLIFISFVLVLPLKLYAQDLSNLERGQQTFENWCSPCHAPGPKHPGTQALDALYQGVRPGVLEQRTDLTIELVKTFVRNGVSVMAPFRKTEISDNELNDLAEYLSTAGKNP